MPTAKPKSPSVNVINVQVCPTRQSFHYVELLSLGNHKLRVDIQADTYDFQSHARIERWDGNQWQLVAFLLYPEMKTKYGAIRAAKSDDFRLDRDRLINLATAILL